MSAEDLPGGCFLKSCLHSTKRMWEGESTEMLFWPHGVRLHLPIRTGSSLMPLCWHLCSAKTLVAKEVRLTPVNSTHTLQLQKAQSRGSWRGTLLPLSHHSQPILSNPAWPAGPPTIPPPRSSKKPKKGKETSSSPAVTCATNECNRLQEYLRSLATQSNLQHWNAL